MNVLNKLVVVTLPAVPKSVVRHFADRYIAGEHIDDAVKVVRKLNLRGLMSTLDVLGEDVTKREEAIVSREESKEVIRRIADEKLDSNLSIKLTSLGLKLDKQFCIDNVGEIVRLAGEYKNFVRIDMEDSSCTSDTIDVYHAIRKEFSNVGLAIQAYLRRSGNDVSTLVKERANIRLCKGIYVEPGEIAFQSHEEINWSYTQLLRDILSSRSYVGIATHDMQLVEEAYALIKELKLQGGDYEFQMLLGVRPELRDRIVRDGHRMRIYVPYGRDWYGYSLRRFKENPQIAGYVLKSIFSGENSH